MPLPLVPDPRDLPRAVERATRFVDELVGLVPRATALLTSAEELLARAHRLVDRIEETRSAAATVVTRTDETRIRADTTVASAQEEVRRTAALLDTIGPPLVRLQPALERLAETTDPTEVDAMVALVDSLGDVGPDLKELLEIASQLNDVLGRVPGVGRLKKKVEEEHDTPPVR